MRGLPLQLLIDAMAVLAQSGLALGIVWIAKAICSVR